MRSINQLCTRWFVCISYDLVVLIHKVQFFLYGIKCPLRSGSMSSYQPHFHFPFFSVLHTVPPIVSYASITSFYTSLVVWSFKAQRKCYKFCIPFLISESQVCSSLCVTNERKKRCSTNGWGFGSLWYSGDVLCTSSSPFTHQNKYPID